MYRDIENIPVLAKAGAIIPMSVNDRINDCDNPENLEVWVYRGNNTFTLYEDDGETLSYKDGQFLKTAFTVKEDGSTVVFTVNKEEGDASVVPEKRNYTIKFKDVVGADVTVKVNGRKRNSNAKKCEGILSVDVSASPEDSIEITLADSAYLTNKDKKQDLTETIAKFQMGNDYKGMLFTDFLKKEKALPPMTENFTGPIDESLALYRG